MKRRFTHINVSAYVNVSSSCNYTAEVYFYEAGVFKSYWYDPQIGLESKSQNHFTRNVPKYVTQAIENELRRSLETGRLKFFEYNQDGVERYHDLRYADPEYFARLIGIPGGES